MRVNIQKFLTFAVVVLILWYLVSVLRDSKPSTITINKSTVDEIETKILSLQKRIDAELIEADEILNKVKDQLSKKPDRVEEDVIKKDSRIQIIPVLVMSCDRVTVKRCLDNLIKYRPSDEIFPIIVSQDCGHNKTYEVIKSYVDKDPSISVVRQPDLSEIQLPKPKVKFRGYYKIARHFKFALNYVLVKLGYDAVIIVEDDLDISPDFFEYFSGTYHLLLEDPTLWCISAWNDNGKRGLIDLSKPELLHRTDFFPGLGWLLRKEMWKKLERHWPEAFFDDWLRDPKNVEGKSCIRPEISRTYSFGKVGVSKGLFFDNHLKHIQLNDQFVHFKSLDLSYLLKKNFDDWLKSELPQLPLYSVNEVRNGDVPKNIEEVRVTYKDAMTFKKIAKTLGLMADFRSGVPRTAYRGVVECYVNDVRVFLTPDFEWTHYNPIWS